MLHLLPILADGAWSFLCRLAVISVCIYYGAEDVTPGRVKALCWSALVAVCIL